MSLYLRMIIHETIKKNAMTQETMKHEILTYESELRFIYEECRDAFGHLDKDTQTAFKEWNVVDELITRLNLQDEKF